MTVFLQPEEPLQRAPDSFLDAGARPPAELGCRLGDAEARRAAHEVNRAAGYGRRRAAAQEAGERLLQEREANGDEVREALGHARQRK